MAETVLLIEDDADVRRLLHTLLEHMGRDVIEAADGPAGLDLFRAHPTPVVITDLLMPVKEGLETIRELRSLSPDVRILAISGGGRSLGARDVLGMARGLGADSVLQKPFGREDFERAIAELESGA